MKNPLKNARGTTLVELMVCLVLLGIFSVAAVTLVRPGAEAFMQVQRLTRAQNLADSLVETLRGELVQAEGYISFGTQADNETNADSVFSSDSRTECTALQFSVSDEYAEVLDAGYVPAMYKNGAEDAAAVYDPAAAEAVPLQGYLHMRYYRLSEGQPQHTAGGKRIAYAYTTAYPTKAYMGMTISALKFYTRGWEQDAETGKVHLTSLTAVITVSDAAGAIYTQTAILPLPGKPEFR